MIHYWRVWILVVMVFAALFAIGAKENPYGREGIQVTFVGGESPARGLIASGDIITQLNGKPVLNLEDWNNKTERLSGAVTLTANGKEVDVALGNATAIGIAGTDIQSTNLDFGLDLVGGTRIILQPDRPVTKEQIEQTVATLETRANLYGLKEMRLFSVAGNGSYFIQVEAAGVGGSVITDLLARQGEFKANVLKPVQAAGSTASLQLGSRSYPVALQNDSITINGTVIWPNSTFALEGIEFQYLNRSSGRLLFLATAYTGKDVELVYSDPQNSGIVPQGSGFLFHFAVLLSTDGAQRFADITSGMSKFVDPGSGEEYLDSAILLELDGETVSSLRIAASLGGTPVQSPQIQGGAATEQEAVQERLRLQTILRSGSLPTNLQIASIDVISPTLGAGFFSAAGVTALFAMLAVLAVVFIRYRSLKIALPMVLISFAEVLIVLGLSAQGDSAIWGVALAINLSIIIYAAVKKQSIDMFSVFGGFLIPLLGLVSWTIDLPAIAGLIAAIGTGIDHQIIIADETIRGRQEESLTLKQKIKQAFFIVFGAAATVLAAMFPLVFIGIGLVKGFAITSIIGVLTGILITRPAYARIVQRIVEGR